MSVFQMATVGYMGMSMVIALMCIVANLFFKDRLPEGSLINLSVLGNIMGYKPSIVMFFIDFAVYACAISVIGAPGLGLVAIGILAAFYAPIIIAAGEKGEKEVA